MGHGCKGQTCLCRESRKTPTFGYDLRGKRGPDRSTDRYKIVLDNTPRPDRVVQTYASGLRVRVGDALSSMARAYITAVWPDLFSP